MDGPCAGCKAKDDEIAYLRGELTKQNDRLDRERDRLLAVTSPAALAQVTGQPLPTDVPPVTREKDAEGQEWVLVAGQRVKAEDFDRMAKGEGLVIDSQFATIDEYNRANAMLNSMLSGGPPQ